MHVAAPPTRVDGAPLTPRCPSAAGTASCDVSHTHGINMNRCSSHMHFSMRPIGYKHISSAQQTHRAPKLQHQGTCNSRVCVESACCMQVQGWLACCDIITCIDLMHMHVHWQQLQSMRVHTHHPARHPLAMVPPAPSFCCSCITTTCCGGAP